MVNVWNLAESRAGYVYAIFLFAVFSWRAESIYDEAPNVEERSRAEFILYVLSCLLIWFILFGRIFNEFCPSLEVFQKGELAATVFLISVCAGHALRIANDLLRFFFQPIFAPSVFFYAALEALVLFFTIQ